MDKPPLLSNKAMLVLLLVVLGAEVWRAITDIDELNTAAPAEPNPHPRVPSLVTTLGPLDEDPVDRIVRGYTKYTGAAPQRAVPSEEEMKLNVVPAAVLAPRLLDDRAEMAAYMAAFPSEKYKIANAPGQGRFYVDGPDVIKDALASGRPWEPALDNILRRLAAPGTTVLDAGAHIGTHTMTLAAAVGPKGRVYAFEPQKKLHREQVKNLELNKVTNVVPLRFAVGSTPAIIHMDPPTANNEGSTAVGKGGDAAELRTIDSFGFRNVSLIKMDVEGYEDAVLEGARETIQREKPVLLVEIQGGHTFDVAAPEVRARIVHTIQTVESMGYFMGRLSPYDYLAFPLPKAAQTPKP